LNFSNKTLDLHYSYFLTEKYFIGINYQVYLMIPNHTI